jgi:hypothetical protein
MVVKNGVQIDYQDPSKAKDATQSPKCSVILRRAIKNGKNSHLVEAEQVKLKIA